MSKVVLKTEGQLLKFLQVLAEESVRNAQTGMDARAQQQKVASDIQRGKSTFNEEDPAETSPAPKPAPTPAPEKDPATADSSKKQEISPKFDSLVDAINSLRGAPSTKDATVEAQLRAYYDKLNAPEAAAAILFVRTVSDVMLGNVDGASAPDPRDYEITTTMEKSEESAKAPAPEPKQSATPTPEEGPKPESEEPESEDTAPPIKVGGNQVTEAYRERIRRLMSGR